MQPPTIPTQEGYKQEALLSICSGRPLELELLAIQGAVAQVEVDQVLVRHTQFGRQLFEVGHRPLVLADVDALRY
jgi:hypothetical protein